MMPGINNLIMGAGIALLGIVITGFSFIVTGGNYIAVAYGAVLVGIIQIIIGFFQWLFYQIKSPEKKSEHRLSIDLKVIVRGMIAVAAADNKLDESEIIVIEMITYSLFGKALDRHTIKTIYQDMQKNKKNVIEEFESIANQVTPNAAHLAVKAATMVALSDGEFHKNEFNKITSIAELLQIEADQFVEILDEAKNAIDALIQSQNDKEIIHSN